MIAPSNYHHFITQKHRNLQLKNDSLTGATICHTVCHMTECPTINPDNVMKIEIIGNPGTGNTFGETVIQHADVVAPNATTVSPTYNYYGTDKKQQKKTSAEANEDIKNVYKTEILDYVGKLKPYVNEPWVKTYDTMWLSILALPEIDAELLDPGSQQDTHFNRNLIASIIWVLCIDVIKEKTKTTLAEILEGKKLHPVRLAMNFPDDEITKAIKEIIAKEKK